MSERLSGTALLLMFTMALAAILVAGFVDTRHDGSPGPEWVHDRGSIYWMCTSDGNQLIKDTDTGGIVLGRDDAKCDAGG